MNSYVAFCVSSVFVKVIYLHAFIDIQVSHQKREQIPYITTCQIRQKANIHRCLFFRFKMDNKYFIYFFIV